MCHKWRIFRVQWVSCPLPPPSRCCPPPQPLLPLHPYLPSTKNTPTWASFWCLVRLRLCPLLKMKHTPFVACFLCSAAILRRVSSPSLLPPIAANTPPPRLPSPPLPTYQARKTCPHGRVFGVWSAFICPPLPKTKNAPSVRVFLFQRTLCSPHRAEHLKHTYGCVFCVQHIFCLFSPVLVTTFLGNFLFRYILFKYICGVVDIIIYLFELFYLAPF